MLLFVITVKTVKLGFLVLLLPILTCCTASTNIALKKLKRNIDIINDKELFPILEFLLVLRSMSVDSKCGRTAEKQPHQKGF